MAYDAEVSLRKGSLRPIYADVSAGDGATAEIGTAAVFTLYREDGYLQVGYNAVPVSGYERGPQSTLRVWYLLNSADLDPGVYSGLFSFPAAGSDGINRTFAVDICITILPDVEITATYDALQLTSSPLYQARLYAADTDPAGAIWSDTEITFFLTASGNVPQLAAALALETLALDRAKLANAVRVGAFGNGEAEAYRAIAERAARLRQTALVMPVVHAPDQVFVPASDGGRMPGNMDRW